MNVRSCKSPPNLPFIASLFHPFANPEIHPTPNPPHPGPEIARKSALGLVDPEPNQIQLHLYLTPYPPLSLRHCYKLHKNGPPATHNTNNSWPNPSTPAPQLPLQHRAAIHPGPAQAGDQLWNLQFTHSISPTALPATLLLLLFSVPQPKTLRGVHPTRRYITPLLSPRSPAQTDAPRSHIRRRRQTSL